MSDHVTALNSAADSTIDEMKALAASAPGGMPILVAWLLNRIADADDPRNVERGILREARKAIRGKALSSLV